MKIEVRMPISENSAEARKVEALSLPTPYLLFLGDTTSDGFAKTAFGLRDWAGALCIGECRLPSATVTTGLPELTPQEAHAKGARALVIGVANVGGIIPPHWVPLLLDALYAGLDIVAGMHARISAIPEVEALAKKLGRRLIDVRFPPADIPVASGQKRSGRRLLTVGTDCALGKKYAALAIFRGFAKRGIDCDFRATGQTGILISGSGIPIDAVVADFAAGAAELISPTAHPDHWDIIEGQGSLFHPSYAGVSLALLHGSQPDVFVVCHQPGRISLLGNEAFPIPPIEAVVAQTLALGRVTNAAIRCGGVALNTSHMTATDADTHILAESNRLGLAVADPIRGGSAFNALLNACLQP